MKLTPQRAWDCLLLIGGMIVLLAWIADRFYVMARH